MNGYRHLSYNPDSVYIVLKRDCRKRQAIDTIRDKLPIENRYKKGAAFISNSLTI